MYGNVGLGAINTGVPAAIIAMSGSGQWSLLSGVALAGAGSIGLAVLARSRRLCARDFEGVSGGAAVRRGPRHRADRNR